MDMSTQYCVPLIECGCGQTLKLFVAVILRGPMRYRQRRRYLIEMQFTNGSASYWTAITGCRVTGTCCLYLVSELPTSTLCIF